MAQPTRTSVSPARTEPLAYTPSPPNSPRNTAPAPATAAATGMNPREEGELDDRSPAPATTQPTSDFDPADSSSPAQEAQQQHQHQPQAPDSAPHQPTGETQDPFAHTGAHGGAQRGEQESSALDALAALAGASHQPGHSTSDAPESPGSSEMSEEEGRLSEDGQDDLGGSDSEDGTMQDDRSRAAAATVAAAATDPQPTQASAGEDPTAPADADAVSALGALGHSHARTHPAPQLATHASHPTPPPPKIQINASINDAAAPAKLKTSLLSNATVGEELLEEQDEDEEEDEDEEDNEEEEDEEDDEASAAERAKARQERRASVLEAKQAEKDAAAQATAQAHAHAQAQAKQVIQADQDTHNVNELSEPRTRAKRAREEEESEEASRKRLAAVMEDEADPSTPAADTPAADEETGADETAIKRQEALDTLTGIEVDFAILRDRLYEERMSEAAREALLLHQGTHPELARVRDLIEARRSHAQSVTQAWQTLVVAELERVRAATQERIWSTWRTEVGELRTDLLDGAMRKRRLIDRERRSLDRTAALQPSQPGLGYELAIERDANAVAQAYARTSGYEHAGPETAGLDQEEQRPVGGLLAYPMPRGLDANAANDLAQVGLIPGQVDARLGPVDTDPPEYEYGRYERRSPPRAAAYPYPMEGYWA